MHNHTFGAIHELIDRRGTNKDPGYIYKKKVKDMAVSNIRNFCSTFSHVHPLPPPILNECPTQELYVIPTDKLVIATISCMSMIITEIVDGISINNLVILIYTEPVFVNTHHIRWRWRPSSTRQHKSCTKSIFLMIQMR